MKAQRPVQREPKQVLAELVEKLQGKLGDAQRRAATDEGSRSGRVFPGATAGAGGDGGGDALCLDAGSDCGRGARGGGGQPAADGGVEAAKAQE